MMTLSIPLNPQAEAALRQRAAASGKDPGIVAAELLSRVLTRTAGLTQDRLEQISGETHLAFLAAGMTDDELGDELEQIKHADREKQRGTPFKE